jgi:hypothetical protein
LKLFIETIISAFLKSLIIAGSNICGECSGAVSKKKCFYTLTIYFRVNLKLGILSVALTALTTTFYGLSVFAGDEISTDCSYSKDSKTAFCSTSDSGDNVAL